MSGGDELHASQGFQPTLRLAGLRRLRSKALHKKPHMRDLALLRRVGSALLGKLLGALTLEG